jgi:ATP-binding cassette subfamily F protein 3
MADLGAEKQELERRLGDPAFYGSVSPAEVQAASRRCADVVRELGEAEERWLDVQAELEAIGEP